MNCTDLKHGDVLLFERRNAQPLIARLIRLSLGSKFTHAAVVLEVDNKLYVLEQQLERMHSILDFYYPFTGEIIHCVRPKFSVSKDLSALLFYREDYGYLNILDCALNHLLHRVTFKKWVFKPILVKHFKTKNIVCSALVARAIRLTENTSWCKDETLVEPNTFMEHPDDLEYLGPIVWDLTDDN